MYNECIQLTRQFTFCPNAFRIDLYKGCDFGCQYCFANMDWAQYKQEETWDIADFNKIKRIFYLALETDKQGKDILVELIRHRVPIHCGGMSDPFQSREKDCGLTKQLIQLSNQYSYPVQFSTKTARFPEGYINILNPKIHAFQVSIMGWDDEYIHKWEMNTPSAKERLDFVKYLRENDFWCGIRIQPIIDGEQAIKLCNHIKNNADYVTIEHFKSVLDCMAIRQAIINKWEDKTQLTTRAHKLEVRKDIRLKNIKQIIEIMNAYDVCVGVGDNDLHYMTQGRCCCGIDRIEGFENYLKYNLTYFVTGEHTGNEWVPKCNPRKHINDQKYGLDLDCKKYVDDYIREHPDYTGKKKRGLF